MSLAQDIIKMCESNCNEAYSAEDHEKIKERHNKVASHLESKVGLKRRDHLTDLGPKKNHKSGYFYKDKEQHAKIEPALKEAGYTKHEYVKGRHMGFNRAGAVYYHPEHPSDRILVQHPSENGHGEVKHETSRERHLSKLNK
jgi:hypothetical protein